MAIMRSNETRSASARFITELDGEGKEVKDLIIAKNVIKSNSGDLISIDSAHLVETATTNLDVTQL